MSVTEYEREFVRLSKYGREYVSNEAIMCNGLNEDIRLLVGILELKEFVVLVGRACKAEEHSKGKRKVDFEARDSRKRSMSKPYHSSLKKSRDSYNRSNASVGYSNRDRGKQYTSPKAQATSISSVGSNLVSSKSLPIEFTKFVIKVLNPLGKYVLVNKVCKNFPLKTHGYCFLADLMLLPFDEFDVILGMDWLTLHNAVVNCRRKTIKLKCQNS
ncbi:DNA/RNA polymerases superfamily protein [Gossypium australe]|uniref:DNA/RNA polymerases superfamily protein n=1 Tax=Gossypium australe TaxID=47621 RepID=A0A5B6WRE6_9ROSI|nr:DNA/RNA polymerases superfamily protein [Gossypium australe]